MSCGRATKEYQKYHEIEPPCILMIPQYLNDQQNYELQTSVSFRKGYFRESLLWITTICFQLIRHDDQSYTQNYHACICMFCEIKNIAHIALSFVFALKAVSLPDSCLIKKPSHGNPTLSPAPPQKNPKISHITSIGKCTFRYNTNFNALKGRSCLALHLILISISFLLMQN